MLRQLYSIYRNHVAREVEQLRTSRSYSLTWAIEEARYLIAALISPISSQLLEDELKQLQVLAVENKSERIAISPMELAKEKEFWTIECTLLQPAEALIREAATPASLSGLVRAMKLPNFEFPDALVLCGVRPSTTFGQFAYGNREVDKIVVSREQRRIDLRWTERMEPRRWLSFPAPSSELLTRLLAQRHRTQTQITSMYVGSHGIDVSGDTGPALITLDNTFLMPSTPAANFLKPWLEKVAEPQPLEILMAAAFNLSIINDCLRYSGKVSDPERIVMSLLNQWENDLGSSFHLTSTAKPQALIQFIGEITWTVFAPSAWSRKWTTDTP
jgi:hypothetical protein